MRNSGWRQTWMLDQGYFSSKVWAIQVLCNLLSTHTLQLIQQVISTQCNQFVVSIFKSPRRTGFHNSYVSLMVLGISGKFIRSNAIFLCAIGARNFRVNQITLAVYAGFYGGVNVLYGNKSTFTMISQFYIMLIIRSKCHWCKVSHVSILKILWNILTKIPRVTTGPSVRIAVTEAQQETSRKQEHFFPQRFSFNLCARKYRFYIYYDG